MNDAATTPGNGDVQIELGGETVTLKLTLECCRTLSRMNSGIYGPGTIGDRLTRMDIDAYCDVVRAGLGLTGNAVKNLDQLVFEAGMVNLTRPLTRFIIGLGDPDNRRKQEADDKAPLTLADAAAQAEAARAAAVAEETQPAS